jgi:hypothetical protein
LARQIPWNNYRRSVEAYNAIDMECYDLTDVRFVTVARLPIRLQFNSIQSNPIQSNRIR